MDHVQPCPTTNLCVHPYHLPCDWNANATHKRTEKTLNQVDLTARFGETSDDDDQSAHRWLHKRSIDTVRDGDFAEAGEKVLESSS